VKKYTSTFANAVVALNTAELQTSSDATNAEAVSDDAEDQKMIMVLMN